MDQTNPLAELTHKRRLSALGPGGLRRERAGFDVRDVHNSHYGRICPIETPEGPNIGLIGSLATYGRINEFGFIETPYRKVINRVPNKAENLVGQMLRERVALPDGTVIADDRARLIDETLAEQIASLGDVLPEVRVMPQITEDIVYLSADEEDRYTIAQANAPTDEQGHFVESRGVGPSTAEVPVRSRRITSSIWTCRRSRSSRVSAALIPFLEHDDANRALMGSNMQRQAVPLLRPEAPIVGTGIERQAAVDSGQVVVAQHPGEVIRPLPTKWWSSRTTAPGGHTGCASISAPTRAPASTSVRSSSKGDRVEKGQVLGRLSSSTELGEMALGQNVLVAFLSWEGGNYEDAILISERMVQRRQVHLDSHREARDRGTRYQARARGDHPRHPERRRGCPEGPGRVRHRSSRRRGGAGRHPGRQDHAQGRDRAEPGREAAARRSSARRRAR